MAYLLPSLAGIFFALIGIAYRKGQGQGVSTAVVVAYMGAAGILVFTAKALATLPIMEAPARLWVLAIAAGLTQYASIKLAGWALERGPLSPMWCAMNLVFVPVIGYAALCLGERIDLTKALGIAAAVASVVVGSLGASNGASTGPQSLRARLVYFAILVGALVSNSILHGSVKDLGVHRVADGRTIMVAFGDLYLALVYIFMGVPTMLDLAVRGDRAAFTKAGLGVGMLAAAGSLGGMIFISAAAAYPAAIVFTLSAVMSLAGGALSSVLFFGERASPTWFAMMGLALAAVVLVSV